MFRAGDTAQKKCTYLGDTYLHTKRVYPWVSELTGWVKLASDWSPGPAWRKRRTHCWKLSSDPYMHTLVLMCFHIHANKHKNIFGKA